MSERKSAPRLERLLDLIAAKPEMTADEAARAIAEETEPENVAERSIGRVEAALAAHPETFKAPARRTIAGSVEDKEGRDLIVSLVRQRSLPNLREISIEIKSSPGGINHFRYNPTDGTIMRVRKDRIESLGEEAAIEEYLNGRRIIDLDARRPDLEAELMRRFELLRAYWKDRFIARKKRARLSSRRGYGAS